MQMTNETGLALLREPFKPNQISKLPKPTKKDAVKGHCNVCNGWHGLPAVHLDYVGHAALTDRLLDADPMWTWEPLSMADGLPVLDGYGGMWIKLTVCGVTRMGYGHAGDKTGGDAIKEVIGDALRNAAMRFGAALDLWHKGDLHADEEEEKSKPRGVKAAVLHNNDMPEARKSYLDGLAEDLKREWIEEKRTAESILDYCIAEGLDNEMEPIYLSSKLPADLNRALAVASRARNNAKKVPA